MDSGSLSRVELQCPMRGGAPGRCWLGGYMHFLILLLGAFAGAAYWYFWMRGPAAAGDVIDAAGHVKGAYKRRKFRQKVEASTLTGIDDPGLAACVFLVSLADAGPGLGPQEENAITEWLRNVVEYRDCDEALTFSKWASGQVVDVNEVVRRLAPLWREHLNAAQRRDLIGAATSVAAIRGPDAAQATALRRLKESLADQ